MKKLFYPLGHSAGETMTVGELRAKLAEYSDDLPVFATWEGIHTTFNPTDFQVESVHIGPGDLREDALVIDVDQ